MTRGLNLGSFTTKFHTPTTKGISKDAISTQMLESRFTSHVTAKGRVFMSRCKLSGTRMYSRIDF